MSSIFDTDAPRKATNVSINSDLLTKARDLRINLSATLERALAEQVIARQRELWKKENRGAIEAYNEWVAANGSFGDGLRSFDGSPESPARSPPPAGAEAAPVADLKSHRAELVAALDFQISGI